MKILIASDKFKGSLSATEVGQALQKGILKSKPNYEITIQPMADGGDGSIDLLQEFWQLQRHECTVNDPLFRPIQAVYYTNQKIAFIELSKASGLALLKKIEQNPLETTTLGTGELILDAYQKGFKQIKLFIGGSATNDAALGIASALGYTFFDKNKNILLPIGKNLIHVNSIVKSDLTKKINDLDIQVICDVNNPFFGNNGAAYTYARQKGADDTMINFLDNGLRHLHEIFKKSGFISVQNIAGAGAAGGVGGGMMAFFKARQIAGIDLFINLFDIENKIQEADLIVTGEGRLDSQSFDGKVVGGIHQIAQQYHKPLIIVCGQHLKNYSRIFDCPIYNIIDSAKSVEDAIENGADYLNEIGQVIISRF